jgi:hypothetical protein
MNVMKPLSYLAVLSLMLSINLVNAEERLNNLTTQQYRVDRALDAFNAKKSSYDYATKLIKQQTKRVQKQEKKLAAARELLEERKLERSQMDAELARLDSIVKVEEEQLNIIWDQTHKSRNASK